jgi:hypothetical protein
MKRPRRDWVFLFESSADRDPLLARTQAEVVRTILENAEPDDTFAVLTTDTQVRRFAGTTQRVMELTSRRQAVPRIVLDRVMAVADHWRAVDPAEWIPCSLAARIPDLAGERELAWSYLTTPAALHGATAADWLDVARQQHLQDDYDLAERAFALASRREPANAAIVWGRSLNHRQAGRTEAARARFKQIAEGTWEDRYKLLQIRAAEELSRILDR